MKNKSLFISFYKTLLKSRMQYKLNFILEILVNVVTYVTIYLSLFVLFSNFSTLGGWNYHEIIVLYSVNLFTYGVACLFLYIPMTHLENTVVNGEFDSVLIRPIHPIRYLIMKQSYIGFLSHVVVSVAFFFYGIRHLGLALDMPDILIFILNVLGGVLIQSSIFILFGALSFKYHRVGNLLSLVIYRMRGLTDYPLSIYPALIRNLLMLLPPYAFVGFIPVALLLNQSTPFQAIPLAPFLVGLFAIGMSIFSFERMILNYSSAGN